MSLAKRARFIDGYFGISLVYRGKSRGEMTEPYGTPTLMGCDSESKREEK